jgi:sialate O-acetylesterase
VTIKDVLVGEVWIGSGQSNREFTISKKVKSFAGVTNEEQEIAAADYPRIRMFTVAAAKVYEPAKDVKGEWKLCTPENVPAFSAVGYYFARDLQKAINQPVGIVTTAFGASCAEAWISRETMSSDPKLQPYLEALDAAVKFYRENPNAPAADAPRPPRTINNRSGPNPPARQRDPSQDQHYPTVCYQGMVAPLVPMAVRGVIWYQGESIIGGTRGLNEYGYVQSALVKDWRKQFGQPSLPFYIVQLPGQQNLSNNPRVREEQATILELPNTGMVVSIDLGEARDVHPHNKAPVGDRLARIALANVYGKPVEAAGPMFRGMTIDGHAGRVNFEHAQGLAARGEKLTGFQIAGADKKFVDAEAKIDGNSVIVSSPQVAAPVAVRYAWDNYPEGIGCNLFNAAGLPAAPFRTDKWDYPIEGITESPVGVTHWEKPATQPQQRAQ